MLTETRCGWGCRPCAADGNCLCLEKWIGHVVTTNKGHPGHESCSLEELELPVHMEVQVESTASQRGWPKRVGEYKSGVIGLMVWPLELCPLLSHHVFGVKRGKNKQHSLPPTSV